MTAGPVPPAAMATHREHYRAWARVTTTSQLVATIAALVEQLLSTPDDEDLLFGVVLAELISRVDDPPPVA